jgi:uncharacterized protein involved in exopolysaccharide biosynthesis
VETFRETVFDLGRAGDLLRSKFVILATTAVLGIAAGVAGYMFLPRAYTATTAFLPAQSSSGGASAELLRNVALGSLGGLAGFMQGMSNAEVYPDIIASRHFISRVLAVSPATTTNAANHSIKYLLGFDDRDSTRSTEMAYAWVHRQLSTSINRTNGLVTLNFKHTDPQLAATFLTATLACLNEFNTDTRQSQARSVRIFLEERIVKAKADLGEAEDQLIDFRKSNVRFSNSPALAIGEGRIERRVRLAEGIFQTLSQQYELARVDEARDTPTFTVIEPPVVPSIVDRLGMVKYALIGAAIGLLLGSLWVVRPAWGLRSL